MSSIFEFIVFAVLLSPLWVPLAIHGYMNTDAAKRHALKRILEDERYSDEIKLRAQTRYYEQTNDTDPTV